MELPADISQANADGSVVHRLLYHFLLSAEPFPETFRSLLDHAAFSQSGPGGEPAGALHSLAREHWLRLNRRIPENITLPANPTPARSCLPQLRPAFFSLPEVVSRPPAIVHRLDIGTTGILVVAKTMSAATSLRRQWSQRRVVKGYVGVCTPEMTVGQTVDAAIRRHPTIRAKMQAVRGSGGLELCEGGDAARPRAGCMSISKTAVSVFRPLGGRGEWGLFGALALTGRTHQIRAHLEFIGHPLLGDPLYGSNAENTKLQTFLCSPDVVATGLGARRAREVPEPCTVCTEPQMTEWSRRPCFLRRRPLLHAYMLKFSHPATDAILTFKAPLPLDLLHIMNHMGIRWEDRDRAFESIAGACDS